MLVLRINIGAAYAKIQAIDEGFLVFCLNLCANSKLLRNSGLHDSDQNFQTVVCFSMIYVQTAESSC